MAIYTRKGDQGTTSLVSGERVSKCCDRVCAYGDVDELISVIGLLRASENELIKGGEYPQLVENREFLLHIQKRLMDLSAHLATNSVSLKLKPFDPQEIELLEREIDKMTELLPKQKYFVLPSSPTPSAICHVARTVCRRAERSAIQIAQKDDQDELAIRYLNRLSDYLFTLARKLCYDCGESEEFWIP